MLASDRSLAELHGLGPEMTSRLAGGLVCEIEPPEFATRLDNRPRSLSREMGLTVDDDVLRDGRGADHGRSPRAARSTHRLQAMSQAYEQPISRELADEALADLARHSTRTVRLARRAEGRVRRVRRRAGPTALRSQRAAR